MDSNYFSSLLTKAACTSLAVLVLSVSLNANVPTPPTPPPTPAGYCQTINTELTNDLNSFNTTLSSLWNGSTYPVVYAGNLPSANGNVGPHLTDSAHFVGVQNQLQELQAMGYTGVMIEIGFPVLYAPFYSTQAQYQQYVNFYAQVASTIRAMGMKIIVENDALLSNDVQAGWTNTAAFFSTLNWSQYQAGRAQMAATIAQVIQPDYLVLGEEPDSEANQAGQPNVNIPANAAAMIAGEITAVQALGLPVKLGAGFGSWVANLNSYISNYVALPLDYIDFHIYPINNEGGGTLIGNALTIASAAAAAGKPVAMSETWLWKMEDSEWLVMTPDQYRAREPFSFWAPENTYFLQTMQNLANYTQMLYQAPSEPNFFAAYQTYGGTTANGGAANCTCTTASCVGSQIINTETSLAQTANNQAVFTTTGIGNYNLLVPQGDSVPPSTPLTLTGSAFSTSASIFWGPSTDDIGVAGYNVLRNGMWIANTTGTAYNDTALATSTTYNYQVQAFDLAGNTSLSSPTLILSTAYILPPSTPTNVVATPYSTAGFTVTWSASQDPQGISSYQILRGASPSSLVQVAVVTGATTSYKDSSLTASTTYYYAVTATQAIYVSTMSSITSGTTLALPSAPTSPTATANSTSQVALSWIPGPSGMSISSYQVLRGTTPSSLVKVASRTTTSYTDLSLTPGTAYFYAIQETDTGGNISPMSTTVSATTLVLPSAPGSVTATANSTNQVAVSWTPGPSGMSISSYQIFRGTTPSSLVQLTSRTTTSYTDSALTAGTVYFYAIQETDTGGNVSPMSTAVSSTTLALPSAPRSVTATANSTAQVAVNWTPGPSGMSISSYQIFRGTTPSGLALLATRATTSYTDGSLTAGTTYYYAIQETDTGGNVSPMSAAVSVTTLAPPSAPANVTATSNSTSQVAVSWTPGPSGMLISSYQILRGITPSSLALVATRATTSYTDTSLTPGTTYYYAIQETDTGGNISPMSTTVLATTLALPSAPGGVTASATSNSRVAVSWTPGPSGLSISSYHVFRGVTPSALVQVAARTTTSYTDVSLTPNTTYYYGVQETDAGGNVSPMSVTVAVTTPN